MNKNRPSFKDDSEAQNEGLFSFLCSWMSIFIHKIELKRLRGKPILRIVLRFEPQKRPKMKSYFYSPAPSRSCSGRWRPGSTWLFGRRRSRRVRLWRDELLLWSTKDQRSDLTQNRSKITPTDHKSHRNPGLTTDFWPYIRLILV